MPLRERMRILICAGLLIGAAGLSSAQAARQAIADTFTVTTTADTGSGTLRQALLNANADNSANPVSIAFDITTGCDQTTGICDIAPTSALPTVTRANTTIDGFGQPGVGGITAHANTNITLSKGSNSVIVVQVDSMNLPFDAIGADLVIAASGVTVEGIGLVDASFSNVKQNGILLDPAAANAHIEGDYLGMYADGSVAANMNGVMVTGATGVTIGGTTPAAVNIISGNVDGVLACGTAGLTVEGNLIGPDPTGTAGLDNGLEQDLSNGVGIAIDDRATVTDSCPQGSALSTNTVIGGLGLPNTQGAGGNVISWNINGVELDGSHTKVEGNFIGTNAAGNGALGNGDGIDDNGGADIIGAADANAANIISGNAGSGVAVTGNGGTIEGNRVGPTANGKKVLQDGTGISVYSTDCVNATTCPDPPQNVVIGKPGHGNVIAGNGGGVNLTACQGCSVEGNDLVGSGILVGFGFGVTIGGTAAGAGNTITGAIGGAVNIENLSNQTHVALRRNIIYHNSGSPFGAGTLITVSTPGDIVLGVQNYNCSKPSHQTIANDNIPCPVIGSETLSGSDASATVTGISGIARAGASVEVYTATNEPQELGEGGGQIYLGTAMAQSTSCSPSPCPAGTRSWTLGTPFSGNLQFERGQPVTATATLKAPNTSPTKYDTSQFARNFADLAPSDTTVKTSADTFVPGLPCDNKKGVFVGAANMNLRCATAEANLTPARSVRFAIPTTDKNCGPMTIHGVHSSVCTISPVADLPWLIGTGASIDGYAGRPGGAHANTGAFGTADNSVHTIRIEKRDLIICGTHNTIRGLDIAHGAGILYCGPGSTGSVIQGNYLGLDPNGTTPDHGGGIGAQSIFGSLGGTNKATIGGTAPADRNVAVDGFRLNDNGDVIQGNYVGTNAAGTASMAAPNESGIQVGGSHDTVGGLTTGAGNLVSGWTGGGILVGEGSAGTQVDSMVAGNRVGTNGAGTAAIPNNIGISAVGGRSITIGPDNLVSGNGGSGVDVTGNPFILNPTFPELSVTGNVVGLDIHGKPLGNSGAGIAAELGASGYLISRNTVMGNGGAGVQIGSTKSDSTHVVLSQNVDHGNGSTGIDLRGQTNCSSGLTLGDPNDFTPCPANLVLSGAAGAATLKGTTCPGCVVEVFVAAAGPHEGGHGGSLTYLKSVTAGSCASPPCTGDATAFSISGLKVPSGGMITATATQQDTTHHVPYETSGFSGNVVLH